MKPDRDQDANFADDLMDHAETTGFDGDGGAASKNEAAVSTKQRQDEAAHTEPEQESLDEQTKIERVVQNYRVLRTISETPTSVVYKAEHKRTKRRVSIKVIYATQNTNSETINRARVEIERAVHLRHPGIAELIEAGTTDEGHCYFISDFVKGVTLDEYVSIHKLSTMDRLKLFGRICDALQYAHQRCLLHRDLRPSNILIDGKCNPRIVGFAVAAVTEVDIGVSEDLIKKRQFGEFLAYKAPEQISGRRHDIDVRTDLYSMGVIAYELLTQRLPYHVKSANPREYADVINREMPAKPSSVNNGLRGDLEAILLKMLAKDPAERYQNIADTLLDLENYFEQRPISARPLGAFYEFRKLAARYKSRSISVAALALAMVLFGLHIHRTTRESERNKLLSQIQALEATTDNQKMQRDTAQVELQIAQKKMTAAVAAQKVADQKAHTAMAELGSWRDKASVATADAQRAERDADRAETVASFFPDLFQSNIAGEIVGQTASLLLLDEAASLAAGYFDGDPQLQSSVFLNIARAYQNMNADEKATALAKSALQKARDELGERHEVTVEALNRVTAGLFAQRNVVEAEPYARQLVTASETLFGAEHVKTLTAVHNLGMIYFLQDNFADAGDMFQRALDGRRTTLGSQDPRTVASMHFLGRVRFAQGRLADAEKLWREEIAIQSEDASAPRWKLADVRGRLGQCLTNLGKFEEAEGLLLDSHADLRDRLGDDHKLVKEAKQRVVDLYKATGREDLADRFTKGS